MRFQFAFLVVMSATSRVIADDTLDASKANQPEVALRTIAGRVIDENDKPVDGAHIVWHVALGKPGVLLETTTDSEGRFTCSTPDVTPKLPTWKHETLWVFKSGKRLTTANTRRDGIHDEKLQQLEIRLLEDVLVTYTIVSEEQTPLADVAVEPWHFLTHRSYDIIPPSVRKLMTDKSDAEGHVRISRFDRKSLFTIHAVSEKFGTQQIRMDGRNLDEAHPEVELLPAGRIEGQLVADDPDLVKGIDVYLTTQSLNNRMDEGFAQVKTDDEGRFDVPAIPVGTLRIGIRGEDDASELPRMPQGNVRPDDTLEIVIQYEPAVVVWGTIHTDDTDQPIPGAEVSVRYGSWHDVGIVISDADGRYEARVLAGDVYTQVIAISKEFSNYVQTGTPWNERIKVPSDDTPFELPSIRLQPTKVLKGKVLFPDGKPAAKVSMNGVHNNRRYGFTKTTETGEFSMQLPKNVEIEVIQIWLEDSQAPIECEIEQEDPLVLRAKQDPN